MNARQLNIGIRAAAERSKALAKRRVFRDLLGRLLHFLAHALWRCALILAALPIYESLGHG